MRLAFPIQISKERQPRSRLGAFTQIAITIYIHSRSQKISPRFEKLLARLISIHGAFPFPTTLKNRPARLPK